MKQILGNLWENYSTEIVVLGLVAVVALILWVRFDKRRKAYWETAEGNDKRVASLEKRITSIEKEIATLEGKASRAKDEADSRKFAAEARRKETIKRGLERELEGRRR